MALTIDELRQRPTVNVPTAAEVLGISRTHAYEAVKNGTIQVVRVGRRLCVPTRVLLALLEGTSQTRAA